MIFFYKTAQIKKKIRNLSFFSKEKLAKRAREPGCSQTRKKRLKNIQIEAVAACQYLVLSPREK
ncbi:hypothetical protein KFK09_017175 [Dendrobium nobile]|uniref:Uncharacterized protein n=1 Tax=Dendrobium nobile TaxID=94219 RepID=A0A8T3B292_DENNO|nr:hypothetical protein KFK09_017175 [Dendrobium nobile]